MWDGEPPSSSSSEDEAETAPSTAKDKPKKEKKSLRKRLELRFGRKASPPPEEEKVASPPPQPLGEQRIAPWRSNSSSRAEPRVLHGTTTQGSMPSPRCLTNQS